MTYCFTFGQFHLLNSFREKIYLGGFSERLHGSYWNPQDRICVCNCMCNCMCNCILLKGENQVGWPMLNGRLEATDTLRTTAFPSLRPAHTPNKATKWQKKTWNLREYYNLKIWKVFKENILLLLPSLPWCAPTTHPIFKREWKVFTVFCFRWQLIWKQL